MLKKLYDKIAAHIVEALLNRKLDRMISDTVLDAIDIKIVQILVTEVSRLELKPGDTVVLKSKYVLSEKAYDHLVESMKEIFPNQEHKVIVLEEEMDIAMISKGS